LRTVRLRTERGGARALARAGIPALDDYIVEGDYSEESGRQAALRLLDFPARPRAVFAGNDEMAYGALDAFRTNGLRVPEDIALVGFDNPITGKYVPTNLLRLLVRAEADRDNPYVVVLDEMNLARVEYYFSDFLSAMEIRGGTIALRAPNDEADAVDVADDDVPARLPLPPSRPGRACSERIQSRNGGPAPSRSP